MTISNVTKASRYVRGGVSWLFALAALLLIQTILASKAWALVSDDFSQELLDTATWTAVDPVGNSTIETAGSRLLLNVPAGSSHDAWTSGNNSARVIQFISNTDFELEVKFESGIEVPGKIQGILVEESANNYLRFDVTKVGTEARIYATAMVNNAAALQKNKAISAGSPLYMRVKRLGNQWTQLLSYDGVVWSPINVFSHPLAVTAVGVFAGNSGGASAPQHTAMVDYFFSTANPISPEDGEIIADTTAPFIRDIKTITGINQFEVRWQTDEPASARLEYGPTTSYGAVIENIELERQHTLVAPGLASDTTYHYRLRSRDANGNEQVSGDYTVRVSPDPFLTIWNGSSQFFGQLGSNAQRWVNILGDVSSASAISTLEYSLNGGAARPLSLGPDGLRLQNTNDFTIDIDHLELLDGSNTLAITASNSTGRAKTENIALNYASNNNWPLPYFIDWSTVSRLENVAQVVDGKWQVSNGAVRTAQLGYDRLLNIGDISWDNYEVTVPVTLHNVDQSCLVDLNNNPCNGGPLFGFLMRWQGHQLDGQQPHSEWKPLGALGAYLWRTDATAQEARPGLYLFGGTGQIINRNYARDVPVGVTHIFKMRAETTGIEHQYKFKMWQAGQTEPSAWDLQGAQNFNESLGNGSLLLLAHYADVSFGNVQVMPLGGSPDTNAPVISNVIVSAATETTATITWTTDEAANSQVDYGLSTTYDKTGSSAGFVTSHSITLTGLAPNTLHHFRVSSTDASGNAANGIDLTFTTTSPGGGVSPSGLVSDGFDDSSLNGRWTWADSAGDSTVSVNGSQLVIAVPAGTNHNLWNGTLDQAPRVRQAANNTDLVLEVKFDSTVSRKYQMQGITVEQDANNLLRFDFFSDGTLTYVYAASIVNGLATKRIQKTIINGAPLYLRVTRVGNQWTEAYSYDGANWTTAGTFAHTLAVSSAAIYGGNFSTGTPPAHTVLVDYFTVDNLPPGSGGGDTTAPVISNVVVSAITATSATISWTTDETASSRVDYGLDTTYGQTANGNGPVTSHSVTLTNLVPGTLHHYRVSSSDASGNTANGTDRTFTTTSPGGGVSPSGLVSDGFDDSSLNGRWTWADSAGDSTVSVNGSQLVIAVPAGTNHNLWNGTLDQAPRVRQAANNTDLVLEVKFDSTVSRKYQMQGITVEQDANNLLRFDFFSDGTLTYVYAASIVNGLATKRIQKTIINGAPLYLRVTRVGNQWTEAYSYDGANWTTAGTFAHTLAVSSAAIYGGNFSTGTPPAHTVLVDYFTVDNLPPGSGGGDTTAPVISNVVVSAITATSATISWTTDETASSRVDYGLDTTYGQTANGNGPVTSHSVTLTNLVPGTLHHYRVSSSDASGNTVRSVNLSFETPPTTNAGTLTAVPISSSRVDIFWDTVAGTTNYKVYRDGTLQATVNSGYWSDTTAGGDDNHSYEVIAQNTTGNLSIIGSASITTVHPDKGYWWNPGWPYRALVGIGSNEFSRVQRVAEVDINFTAMLANIGASGMLDSAAIHCHEVDSNGNLKILDVPCQFDPSVVYNAQTRATGKMVILASGTTKKRSARYFHIYFSTVDSDSPITPRAIPLVKVTDQVFDEDQYTYKISTSSGEYFYQKAAGGFSSLVDADGKDWISYHPTGGAAGNYRGIPNLVFPEGHFHPGITSSTSTLVSVGPVKATIDSITADALWKVRWEFYPTTATMTVLAAPKAYWFLYEGTPGGVLEPNRDFSVRSNGNSALLSTSWSGDLIADEWVYFADPTLERSLFLAKHEDDSAFDSYRPMEGVMTVFGFGRNNLSSSIDQIPAHFTIGLIATSVYNDARDLINSAIKPVDVALSAAVFNN